MGSTWTEAWQSQWQFLILVPSRPKSIFFTELCYKSREVITHKEILEKHYRLATSPCVTLLHVSKRSLMVGPSTYSQYLKSLVSCHWSQDSSLNSKRFFIFRTHRGMNARWWKPNADFTVLQKVVNLPQGRKVSKHEGIFSQLFNIAF